MLKDAKRGAKRHGYDHTLFAVCENEECIGKLEAVCVKAHTGCGHLCMGQRGESVCLPCLQPLCVESRLQQISSQRMADAGADAAAKCEQTIPFVNDEPGSKSSDGEAAGGVEAKMAPLPVECGQVSKPLAIDCMLSKSTLCHAFARRAKTSATYAG
jgi:hypothetical protein